VELNRRLRLVACLAHVVAGVTVELEFEDGERYVVAYQRLDAELDPCQLRCAVLELPSLGTPRLVEALNSIEVVGGIEHLGGGIYRRRHPCGSEERWFLAELDHGRLVELLAGCPLDVPDELVAVDVMADPELGVSAVRLAVEHADDAWRIDEIAMWGVTATLVDELIGSSASEVS
jgi:hypothetical protein